MMEFFAWTAYLGQNNLWLYAVVNIITMAAVGLLLAGLADLVIKGILKIDLGEYKKEYSEEELAKIKGDKGH
ncbi:MAG: hypothetical protein AB1402_09615 [Bacillota bacterium]|jgi:hypothetical protein